MGQATHGVGFASPTRRGPLRQADAPPPQAHCSPASLVDCHRCRAAGPSPTEGPPLPANPSHSTVSVEAGYICAAQGSCRRPKEAGSPGDLPGWDCHAGFDGPRTPMAERPRGRGIRRLTRPTKPRLRESPDSPRGEQAEVLLPPTPARSPPTPVRRPREMPLWRAGSPLARASPRQARWGRRQCP